MNYKQSAEDILNAIGGEREFRCNGALCNETTISFK